MSITGLIPYSSQSLTISLPSADAVQAAREKEEREEPGADRFHVFGSPQVEGKRSPLLHPFSTKRPGNPGFFALMPWAVPAHMPPPALV